MFKKLKEKITENSPQRLQQITQSLSDRLSSTPSDENFFSIGDDDSLPNMSLNNSSSDAVGFSNVPLSSNQENSSRIRRNSNSSIASDVSFLPRYESSASIYHLQSDLDVSASELEDNASTSSSTLGHLTKEQIYSAFQKAQMRYHKYRGRYTDLARHYKELEQENVKIKNCLVKTQDNAIRRVTELKEQCSLEQKAKAHLEGALRDEIDEKQLKINSLETKITLLTGEEDLEKLTKYLHDARREIEELNERNQELKANLIVAQTKEVEHRIRSSRLEKDVAEFAEREKENNLILAQSKMELHNELLSKDAEILNLKQDNENLKKSLEIFEIKNDNNKLDNLQTQNLKLIEKIEQLTQKCNQFENEILKMEQLKMEKEQFSEKIKEKNLEIERIRSDAKTVLTQVEESIRNKLQADFESREQKLKEELDKKVEELKSFEGLDIELLKESNEKNLKKLHREKDELEAKLEIISRKYDDLQKANKIANEERDEFMNTIAKLENQIEQNVDNENKLVQLEKEKDELQKQIDENHYTLSSLRNYNEDLERNNKRLVDVVANLESTMWNFEGAKRELEEKINKIFREKEDIEAELVESGKDKLVLEKQVAELTQKVRMFEEKQEAIELDSSEGKLLELRCQKLEEEKENLLESFENERRVIHQENKHLIEVKKLYHEQQKQLTELSIKDEGKTKLVHDYEHQLIDLQKEKNQLEDLVKKLTEQVRIFEERVEAKELELSESKMLELKLQQLETENKALLDSFEIERLNFEEVLKEERSKHSLEINKQQELIEHIELLKGEHKSQSEQHIKQNEEKKKVLEEKYKIIEDLKLELVRMEETMKKFVVEREIFEEIKKSKDILEENHKMLQEESYENYQQLQQLKTEIEEQQKEKFSTKEEKDKMKQELENIEKQFKEDTEFKENFDKIKKENEELLQQIESLKNKLSQYKNLDQTNKTSIEFYESELEKLKKQNGKLEVKLDETLVSLNHCADLSDCSTEIEYLKNVLYNYMLGKESLVLARVIAAVCKFDEQQTEAVLAKEQQKQTLLGQLGIL